MSNLRKILFELRVNYTNFYLSIHILLFRNIRGIDLLHIHNT